MILFNQDRHIDVEGYPWLAEESHRDAADDDCGSLLNLKPVAKVTENQKKRF